MKIKIDIANQTLSVLEGDLLQHKYPISSGTNGVGEQNGSNCTPRGKHIVRAKIGAGAEPGTVFVARRPTGEQYSPAPRQ